MQKYILFSALLFSFQASALDVKMEFLNSKPDECKTSNTKQSWTIGGTYYPGQEFFGDERYNFLFGLESTKVKIYDPERILLIDKPFEFYSNIKPIGVKDVIVFQNHHGVKVKSSAKPGAKAILIYEVSRKYSLNSTPESTEKSKFVYTPVGAKPVESEISKQNWSSDIKYNQDCIEINVVEGRPELSNSEPPPTVNLIK